MSLFTKEVATILDSVAYMTLATVSENGEPWNTPVAIFRFADERALYWASWQSNQHSKNIRSNGKAFVVIYDSTPANGEPSAGVYMSGNAYEIVDEQEAMAAAKVFGSDAYNPSDGKEYVGEYPRRIYKFTPSSIWMNDEGEVDGNYIDVRRKV